MTATRFSRGLAGAFLLGLLIAGCVRYQPRPIVPGQSLEDFQARRLDDPQLAAFIASRKNSLDWPPPAWDLEHLTYAAFFFSPDLDVARARWAEARGGVVTAGGRPNPGLSAGVGYNATTPRATVTPWIPEWVLDLLLEVGGKRGLRVAVARESAEAARLNLLGAAWTVRSRVRAAFLRLFVARRTAALLVRQQMIQTESLRILEARLAAGEASPTEVTQARVALANQRVAAADARRDAVEARGELAAAVGVPPQAVAALKFTFREMDRIGPEVPPPAARRQAMLHRCDILAALAEYEASQKALQLEVRKQYPDISLGPGYQLDQTDSKWTLGLGISLPVLNRNRGPIAEAAARREAAGARFLALQSRVLSQVEGAVAAVREAAAQVRAADTLLSALGRQEARARAAYDVGEISRLELLGRQTEVVHTALARVDALARAYAARGALEDAMQTPLDVESWAGKSFQRQARSPKEAP